jgi:uncharacterized protein YjiK
MSTEYALMASVFFPDVSSLFFHPAAKATVVLKAHSSRALA